MVFRLGVRMLYTRSAAKAQRVKSVETLVVT